MSSLLLVLFLTPLWREGLRGWSVLVGEEWLLVGGGRKYVTPEGGGAGGDGVAPRRSDVGGGVVPLRASEGLGGGVGGCACVSSGVAHCEEGGGGVAPFISDVSVGDVLLVMGGGEGGGMEGCASGADGVVFSAGVLSSFIFSSSLVSAHRHG